MVGGKKKESLFDLEPSQLSQVLLAVVMSGKAFGSPANALRGNSSSQAVNVGFATV